MNSIDQVLYLRDSKGELVAVQLGLEIWERVKPVVMAKIEENSCKKDQEQEPIQDWNELKLYWDFKYPLNTEVTCEACGNETKEWESDHPRKFKLKAANLGGLVTFECTKCHSRIIKRHFKDRICCECKPARE